jgi:hypothetical protein
LAVLFWLSCFGCPVLAVLFLHKILYRKFTTIPWISDIGKKFFLTERIVYF